MASKNFQFMLDPNPETDCLRQGDIIERNPSVAAALAAAHDYYATADDYDYFIILTPTCQLLKRNGRFSARYITLAAVRPLRTFIDRELEKFEKKVNSVDGSILKKDKEVIARQLIERVLHNTQDGYLFLPGEFFPDRKDRIAFLLLSVALRIGEHYDACLSGKIHQLAESFSAKVGYLTSDLYGQVATAAIEEQIGIDVSGIFEDYYARYLYPGHVHWMSEERISRLRVQAREYMKQTGNPIPNDQLDTIVSQIPSDGQILADRVLEVAQRVSVARKNPSGKAKRHFMNELLSDPVIKRVAGLD